jgi:hypothetical protein
MTTTMTKTQQSKDNEDVGRDDKNEDSDDIIDKDVGRGRG